jgi:glycosyltransferase involved in cell wall biosynthesis
LIDKERILCCSHSSNSSGAERAFYEMVKALNKNGHLVFCIFPEDGPLVNMCIPYITNYSIYKSPWWFGEKISIYKKIKLLKHILMSTILISRHIKKNQITKVIVNTICIPSPAIAAKMNKVKLLWFIHEIGNDGGYSLIYGEKFTKKFVGRNSSLVICNSNFTKNGLEQYIEKHKLVIAYQEVEINPIIHLENINNYPLRLLLIGRFSESKGQMEAIKALDILSQRKEPFLLKLVGYDDSFYTRKITNYISDKKLNDFIEFYPPTNNILEFYKTADIVLVCSNNETLGRVTIESMKCGLPVIASKISGNMELIDHGINGLFYEYGNPISLVENILALKDPTLRMKIGNNARNWANNLFSEKNFKENLKVIISK